MPMTNKLVIPNSIPVYGINISFELQDMLREEFDGLSTLLVTLFIMLFILELGFFIVNRK